MLHMAGNAIGLRKTADKGFVAIAVAGAQMEVAVGYGEPETRLMEEVGHADGVTASAHGKQHLFSLREEVLLLDEIDETV